MSDGSVRPDESTGGTGCLKVAAIVAIVVIGGIWFALWRVGEGFKGPESADLDMVWATWQVALAPDRQGADARLHLAGPGPGDRSSAVISISLPSRTDVPVSIDGGTAAARADLLRLPRVRLEVSLDGATPASCYAPCELQLRSGDMDVHVDASEAGLAGPVTFSVGAGVIARIGSPLPLGADVRLEPSVEASGGG